MPEFRKQALCLRPYQIQVDIVYQMRFLLRCARDVAYSGCFIWRCRVWTRLLAQVQQSPLLQKVEQGELFLLESMGVLGDLFLDLLSRGLPADTT